MSEELSLAKAKRCVSIVEVEVSEGASISARM